MRKIIYLLLVLALMMSCVSSFIACDMLPFNKDESSDETPDETPAETPDTEPDTAPECPEGYKLYESERISFAYPENWIKQDGSVVILMNSVTGNNITVVYEAKTTMYDNMTVSSFNEMFAPAFQASGMTASNVQITQTTANGLKIIKITYDATVSGVSMSQTLLITNIGDRTYSVSVTEVVKDSELVNTVLETIKAKN